MQMLIRDLGNDVRDYARVQSLKPRERFKRLRFWFGRGIGIFCSWFNYALSPRDPFIIINQSLLCERDLLYVSYEEPRANRDTDNVVPRYQEGARLDRNAPRQRISSISPRFPDCDLDHANAYLRDSVDIHFPFPGKTAALSGENARSER